MSVDEKELKESSQESKKKGFSQPTLLGEVLRVMLKIAIVAVVFVLLFTFMFGLTFVKDNSMKPAVKDGDVVIYYRLDKTYISKDVILVEFEKEVQVRRVVAVAGDVVDITENGLLINGNLQYEEDIYYNTMPYIEGVTFPIQIGNGELFILGDMRLNAVDSRLYGVVNEKDVLGKVMTVIRRRGL
jgi:signal peptidase I, bacterial type